MKRPKPGQKAPDFTALNEQDKPISLSDFSGKKLVIYFYPQDNTPTCTTESCNLRDNYKRFLAQGYEVIGISPDSPRKHRNFISKYQLPFSLVSDEGAKICRLYGVWGMKKLFGISYKGVLRTTFILDENGIITEVIDKVKSSDHANQILGETA